MNPVAFLAIGIGASLGAWMRWGLGHWMNAIYPAIPIGTLVANLLGGYLIGVALAFFSQHPGLPPEWRLFLITGLLGGLTTFSTFSAEVYTLIARSQYLLASLAAGAHLGGSLVMTVLGVMTFKLIKG